MKKIVAFTLIVLCIFQYAAQSQSNTWLTYISTLDSFKIDFPGKPSVGIDSVSTDYFFRTTYVILDLLNDISHQKYYRLNCFSVPDSLMDSIRTPEKKEQLADKVMKIAAASQGGEIVNIHNVNDGDLSGRYYTIEIKKLEGTAACRVDFYNNKMFLIMVVGDSKKMYDGKIIRFFKSFVPHTTPKN